MSAFGENGSGRCLSNGENPEETLRTELESSISSPVSIMRPRPTSNKICKLVK